MKPILWVVALVVCFAHTARAEGRHWLRRATLAASCAASLWDIETTRTAVARGAREANGFFADSAGNPRWGRIIGVKAGLCLGMAAAQEVILRQSSVPWTPLNTGLAGYFTVIALRNRGVANSVDRPRAPAYLLAQP